MRGFIHEITPSGYLKLADDILQGPSEYQDDVPWCAPASTAMVLKYYGKNVHMWDIADAIDLSGDEGANMDDIFDYIKQYPDLLVHKGDDDPNVDDGDYITPLPWDEEKFRDYLVSELENEPISKHLYPLPSITD